MPHSLVSLLGAPAAFSPLSLSPVLWLKADAGLTLSTTGYTGTGTTVAQAGSTLTGVGTAFLSEIVVGDNISGANGLNGNVTAIASNTSLTLDSSATIAAETPYTITPVAGTSDRVTTWADQSGHGNNPTQATAAKKPAQILSGQNGLAIVRCDGANDLLQASFTLVQPEHVFVVAKQVAWTNLSGIIDGATATQMLLEEVTAQYKVRLFANSATGSIDATSGWHVYSCVFNGAGSKLTIDANTPATGNAGAAGGNGITIGAYGDGTNTSKSDVGEIIIVASEIVGTPLANTMAYLKARWNTP